MICKIPQFEKIGVNKIGKLVDYMTIAKEYFYDDRFRICTPPFIQLVTIHCDLRSTIQNT